VVAFGDINRNGFRQAFQWLKKLRPPLVIVIAVGYKVTHINDEINILFYYLLNYFAMYFGVGSTIAVNGETHLVGIGGNRSKAVKLAFAIGVNDAVEVELAGLQILKPGFMNESRFFHNIVRLPAYFVLHALRTGNNLVWLFFRIGTIKQFSAAFGIGFPHYRCPILIYAEQERPFGNSS
jgi:hypothetical protein